MNWQQWIFGHMHKVTYLDYDPTVTSEGYGQLGSLIYLDMIWLNY